MGDTKDWSGLKSRFYSWFNRNPTTNETIVDLAQPRSGQRVLDIGCGPGAAVRNAAPLVRPGAAVGLDRSQPMVEIARKRSSHVPNASFEVGAAEKLPFSDGSFDLIWTVSAFHHWEDQDAGIAEVKRVLRPGGRFIIMEKKTRGKHGLNRERARVLTTRLEAAGFAAVGVSEHDKSLLVEASLAAGAG